MAGIRFNKIWVIESLSEKDWKTGKELYEDVLSNLQIKYQYFEAEYIEINDKKELFDFFGRVIRLSQTGQIPILHFETHGSEDGLTLKSHELVGYAEMSPFLLNINMITQNNLFIIGAACYAAALIQIVRPYDRSPCWGVCGPTEEILPMDLFIGYRAFYFEAFKSRNMNLALEELKKTIPHQAKNFQLISSEYFFFIALKKYFTKECSPENIERRINDMIIEGSNLGLSSEGLKRMELTHRERLSSREGQEKDFNHFKKFFFMHDLYPDNKTLPDPSFDELLKQMDESNTPRIL